jgi:hypothetical protein
VTGLCEHSSEASGARRRGLARPVEWLFASHNNVFHSKLISQSVMKIEPEALLSFFSTLCMLTGGRKWALGLLATVFLVLHIKSPICDYDKIKRKLSHNEMQFLVVHNVENASIALCLLISCLLTARTANVTSPRERGT